MRLVVDNRIQALVDLLRGRLELRQGGGVLLQTRQRGLVAHLETHVDQLVGERGEFIAKAHLVHARFLQMENGDWSWLLAWAGLQWEFYLRREGL